MTVALSIALNPFLSSFFGLKGLFQPLFDLTIVSRYLRLRRNFTNTKRRGYGKGNIGSGFEG